MSITQEAYKKSEMSHMGSRFNRDDFFVSFCIKTKRKCYKPGAVAETVKVAIAPKKGIRLIKLTK